MPRFAIYATPPLDSDLWRTGSSILGYDAASGLDAPFPDHPIFADPVSLAWSAEPRRYGFHATLKAPFRLAENRTPEQLEAEMAAFAAGRHPVAFDLTLAPVGHFLALIAVDPPMQLRHLADDCVRHFDPFREPMSPADRERRHPDHLIQRQVDNLDTWGYPFVFDDFLFHMTLTGALEPDDRHRLEPLLRELLQDVPLRLTIDSLALFRQETDDGRFVLHGRYPLAG